MALKHKAGDRVRIVQAAAFPQLIGKEVTVLAVGPWQEGDLHPNGLICGWDNDYMVSVPDVEGFAWLPKTKLDHMLAVRECNLEAV